MIWILLAPILIALPVYCKKYNLGCEYVADMTYIIPYPTYNATAGIGGPRPLNKCLSFFHPWVKEYNSEKYTCTDDGNNIHVQVFDGPHCNETRRIVNVDAKIVNDFSCDGGECANLYSVTGEIRDTDSNDTCPTEMNIDKDSEAITYHIGSVCITHNSTYISHNSSQTVCGAESDDSYTTYYFSSDDCTGEPYETYTRSADDCSNVETFFDSGDFVCECTDYIKCDIATTTTTTMDETSTTKDDEDMDMDAKAVSLGTYGYVQLIILIILYSI